MTLTVLAARFFAKTRRDPATGCLLWTGSLDGHGYGQIRVAGLTVGAHRVAWLLRHGRWPLPCALHKCDAPACVEVEHLFEGTKEDNTADMVAKGRELFAGRDSASRAALCVNGHLRTAANTYRYRGATFCRECNRIASARYQQKKRLKAAACPE